MADYSHTQHTYGTGLYDTDASDMTFYMHRIGPSCIGSDPQRVTLGYLLSLCLGGYDMSFRGTGVIVSRRHASPAYGPIGCATVLAFCVPCDDIGE